MKRLLIGETLGLQSGPIEDQTYMYILKPKQLNIITNNLWTSGIPALDTDDDVKVSCSGFRKTADFRLSVRFSPPWKI